jgi:DNA-binding NarL/FixJ family response regulator
LGVAAAGDATKLAAVADARSLVDAIPAVAQAIRPAVADSLTASHPAAGGLGARSGIRLLVVDDHPAVRVGLCQLLGDQPDFVVVAVASSAEEAISLAATEPTDVAVVDYQLGRASGLWASRRLKRLPHPPGVVIYSAYWGSLLAAACVVAEADGLVNKGAPTDELFAAIRAAACGHSHLPPLSESAAESIRHRLGTDEQTIFGMLRAGFRRSSVARQLGHSDTELERNLRSMLTKLEEARDRPARDHGRGRADHRPHVRRRGS